jgi:hypothetical protein
MEFKFVQIKGQVLFKGEIIVKMGWGHQGSKLNEITTSKF